ncbi:Undecaprenyl-diphosphatase [Aquisphaera giovannonii]|uniref:Undecaprenyl-diphosphatase n=1 Tax=Aquisphaera giovannonii TaxID=406548 RepID=A0A5B9W1I7_9BACT|nr:undecaprenyl-diphosphate phosphatase [Aquisphaera giovannonii]QEH33840.1 Undecaprenyl-diphosphatase [Aquisphaera giovannonii]
MEWFESLLLGVIQGVTEFLPVSSDGHLAITQQAFAWLTGHRRTGKEDLFFDIMLHVGTLCAILFHYRKEIIEGARGFLTDAKARPADLDTDSGDPAADKTVRPGFDRASIFRVGLLAAVATSPLVPFALLFKKKLEEAFQSTTAAGVGFLITASALLIVTWRMRGQDGRKDAATMTWLDALLIGIAQTAAPLPGVSRSGMTIAAALLLGLTRTWSVGFSLLIAVPAICGAAVFELKDAVKDPAALGLTPDRIGQTLAATVLAGIVGYFAILWLIQVVRGGRLWYFSVYLIGLGSLVLALSAISGGSPDAGPAKSLDRTALGILPRPHPGGVRGRAPFTLARPDATGPRPPGLRAGAASRAGKASPLRPLLG